MGEFIPLIIVGAIFAIFAILIVSYGIRQNKSVIERARKIDPSVKTITEANYVLQKDIAQSFGNKDDETKN